MWCWSLSSCLIPCFSYDNIWYCIPKSEPFWDYFHTFFVFFLLFLQNWHELRELLTVPIALQVIAKHVCSARCCKTLIFLGLYPHSFLPSICFPGEWAARQGLVCGQDKLLFCSTNMGWKTTIPHKSCAQAHRYITQKTFKRTHSHKWTQNCPLKHSMMQLLRSGACSERSSSLWTHGFWWVCLKCLSAAQEVCAYVLRFHQFSKTACMGNHTSISHQGSNCV